MTRLEFPRVNLDAYQGEDKIYALQSQLDALSYNLQIVLDSIEDEVNSAAGQRTVLTEELVTERHQFISAGEVTVEANNYLDGTYRVTKPGYRPVDLSGYAFSGSGRTWLNLVRMRLDNIKDGSCDVVMSVRNLSGNDWAGDAYAYILWAKI